MDKSTEVGGEIQYEEQLEAEKVHEHSAALGRASASHGVRKNGIMMIYEHDARTKRHLLFAACRSHSGPDMEKDFAFVCLAHRGTDLFLVKVT